MNNKPKNNAILNLRLILIALAAISFGCNNSKTGKNDGAAPYTKVDLCRCLTEPGNSDYMKLNGAACDKAISKALGVTNWLKVNMNHDMETYKKFRDLVIRCTEEKTNVKISGVYIGKDHSGKESIIFLRRDGSLIIQASAGDAYPVDGWWTGTINNLSIWLSDSLGNDTLIARAEVNEDGLKMIDGNFYRRQKN